MLNDLNTPSSAPAAAQNGGQHVAADRHADVQALVPANSNTPEEDAQEVAEVYFALG